MSALSHWKVTSSKKVCREDSLQRKLAQGKLGEAHQFQTWKWTLTKDSALTAWNNSHQKEKERWKALLHQRYTLQFPTPASHNNSFGIRDCCSKFPLNQSSNISELRSANFHLLGWWRIINPEVTHFFHPAGSGLLKAVSNFQACHQPGPTLGPVASKGIAACPGL